MEIYHLQMYFVWGRATEQGVIFGLCLCRLRKRKNYIVGKSVCKTAPKSLIWAPTCVPGSEYAQ